MLNRIKLIAQRGQGTKKEAALCQKFENLVPDCRVEMCIDVKMGFCMTGTVCHCLTWKLKFTLSEMLSDHFELKQNGTHIFMLPNELFLITAQPSAFPPFNGWVGSKHIFTACAREEPQTSALVGQLFLW